MSLRIKLLFALLVAALIPMVIMTVVSQGSLRVLGSRVANEQRKLMIDQAESRLQSSMEQIATTFSQVATSIVSTGMLQADYAQSQLSPSRAPQDTFPVHSVDAFRTTNSLEVAQLRLIASVMHSAPSDASLRLVSRTFPVVHGAGENAEAEALRLAGCTSLWQSLSISTGKSQLWQFIILQSGSFAWYPGTPLPEGFDPLAIPFVHDAFENKKFGGISAYVDPITQSVLTGMSGPVMDDAGTVIGVTGVLTSMGNMQEGFSIRPDWDQDSTFSMVAFGESEILDGKPYIIMQNTFADTDTASGQSLDFTFFSIDEMDMLGSILASMRDGEVHTQHVTIDGTPMILASAGLQFQEDAQSNIGVFVSVPTSTVTALAEDASDRILGEVRQQLLFNLSIIASVLALVVAGAFVGSRLFTKPIAQLIEVARKIAGGDLDARADVRTRDELQELAETFNEMTPKLRDHMRVRGALDLAMEVQQQLLPAVAPKITGLDLAGKSIPCDEVGGDYYDFLEMGALDNGQIGIAVGDVTGHGIAAALLMTSARAMLRSRAGDADVASTMAARITEMNRQLAADVSHGRFMTMCWMLLDRPRRTVQWVCAGHDPALLFMPDGTIEQLTGASLPLGIESHVTYTQFERTDIAPGSVIVLGTDGIWEARNHTGEMFGKDRMEKVISTHIHASAAEILDTLVSAVDTFRADTEALDDVTLVVAKWTA